MQRRDFVKAMVAATVSAQAAIAQQPVPLPAQAQAPKAPAPVPWMRGLLETKPLPMTPLVADAVAQTNSHFFNERQAATLHHLCEILQPAYKGYPGAIEAGTPEFLDFLIGVSPVDRQQLYRYGLDRLESDAQRQFQKPFAMLDAAQAGQLIRPFLRTWMEHHPPSEPYELFVNKVHEEIRIATVNSQAWSDAAREAGRQTPNVDLYWYPIDPDLHHEIPSKAN